MLKALQYLISADSTEQNRTDPQFLQIDGFSLGNSRKIEIKRSGMIKNIDRFSLAPRPPLNHFNRKKTFYSVGEICQIKKTCKHFWSPSQIFFDDSTGEGGDLKSVNIFDHPREREALKFPQSPAYHTFWRTPDHLSYSVPQKVTKSALMAWFGFFYHFISFPKSMVFTRWIKIFDPKKMLWNCRNPLLGIGFEGHQVLCSILSDEK